VLGLAGIALLLASCSGSDDAGPGTSGAQRVASGPNVVVVFLDDLDQLTMPYWEAMPKTQARVADRGLVFPNTFVSSPECCPSRATMLTGNYPHNTGVYDSTAPDGGYQAFATNGAEEDTVATRLQERGYHTSFVGKYLNGYEKDYDAVPPGWDDWFALGEGFSAGYDYKVNQNGSILSFGSEPDDYLTDVLAEEARGTIERAESNDGQPFFLALWTSAPHANIDAAPRHAGNPFADAQVPRRANFDEADVSDKPTWLREGIRPLTADDIDDLTVRYRKMMGSLYAVDEMVDEVLTTLEANDELDDTVVIFTSDNGYNFGAHRLPHKMAPYEESIRVPLVVSGPGVRTGSEERLVVMNDLTPTILDLAGLPFDDLDGRSLVPVLRGDDVPWRDDFLVEYHGTYNPFNSVDTLEDVRILAPGRADIQPGERPLAFVPTFRAVRSDRYLYVEWYAGDEHEYELYDLDADPFQLANLVATPEGALQHETVTTAFQARLEELATCAGESCRT
jgi:N-acetylglucosamine-6-sulfatase